MLLKLFFVKSVYLLHIFGFLSIYQQIYLLGQNLVYLLGDNHSLSIKDYEWYFSRLSSLIVFPIRYLPKPLTSETSERDRKLEKSWAIIDLFAAILSQKKKRRRFRYFSRAIDLMEEVFILSNPLFCTDDFPRYYFGM
ncbi:hypothetical protein CEXT_631271 [Caerostris extrusa]|uniref:Maturase K n=1 Tax=Caerostris extrusa TaxID=172846 RepID=A0AAV4YAL0_CAEEX|nr:hypothetical protein CEXT_631271 [Caerostris extrusa]